jgi:hypothetical protein
MSQPVPVHIAVEDLLSEAAARRLLECCRPGVAVGFVFGKTGFGYLKQKAPGFNNAAKGTPFLLLTDLDTNPCASALIAEWLGGPRNPNLLFRVAVREVESWVLADRKNFARLLGIKEGLVTEDPDALRDPKSTLIGLARKSPKAALKKAIVPARGTSSTIGPGYNLVLGEFVRDQWDLEAAAARSRSLKRAIAAVSCFVPNWNR